MSNNSTNRQPGYYRVKYKGDPAIARLIKYKPRYGSAKIKWDVPGQVNLIEYDDEDLIVTDETPIDPNPSPQMVDKQHINDAFAAESQDIEFPGSTSAMLSVIDAIKVHKELISKFYSNPLPQPAGQLTAAQFQNVAYNLSTGYFTDIYSFGQFSEKFQSYLSQYADQQTAAIREEFEARIKTCHGTMDRLSATIENYGEREKRIATTMLHNKKTSEEKDARIKELETQIAGQWISVEDRLPEDGDRVLVCRNKDSVLECCYIERGFVIFYHEGFNSIPIPVTNVTHWMPLPDPPKSLQKEQMKCWETDQPQPCTNQQIKDGQCGCNPTAPENLNDKTKCYIPTK